VSVDAPTTICARTGSSFWHYSGTAWIDYTTPWKSRNGLTIKYNPQTNTVERLTVVGGAVRRDTLMLGGSTVTNFEISGDGSTYYLNDSQNPSGWKVYYSGTTWNFRGLASYVELVPSFNGATVCGISQTANTVNYIPQLTSPKLVTIPGSPARIHAAIIDSLVVVGRGGTISAFGADGVLRTIRTVAGAITGVFADDSSVWVGTDTQTTYLSLDAGQTWLQLNDARAVAPWLVVQNGYFYEVEYIPPEPDDDPGDEPIVTPTPSPTPDPQKPRSALIGYVLGGIVLLSMLILVVTILMSR
jgi:hypothetical protein